MITPARYSPPAASDIAEMPSPSEKFLPTNEQKLRTRIDNIARSVAAEPQQFQATREEVDELSAAARAFSEAFMKARYGGERSKIATEFKNTAREHAKR